MNFNFLTFNAALHPRNVLFYSPRKYDLSITCGNCVATFFKLIIFVNIENNLRILNFLSLFTSELKRFSYLLVTRVPTF